MDKSLVSAYIADVAAQRNMASHQSSKETDCSLFTHTLYIHAHVCMHTTIEYKSCVLYPQLEMWANAQHDGHPAKYRWRPLFNAAKFG